MTNETENKFEPGDVVTLRSGGQRMTVDRVHRLFGPRVVETVWIDGSSYDPVKRKRFDPVTLVRINMA